VFQRDIHLYTVYVVRVDSLGSLVVPLIVKIYLNSLYMYIHTHTCNNYTSIYSQLSHCRAIKLPLFVVCNEKDSGRRTLYTRSQIGT